MAYDEKEEVTRPVPEVTMPILRREQKLKRDLIGMFPTHQKAPSSWLDEVAWQKCGLYQIAELRHVLLDDVPIKLDKEQVADLWNYLAFYWAAFVKNGKKFFHRDHASPDFAIVSALFRETDWHGIGLDDTDGTAARRTLAQAINLLYKTRFVDVVHAHFIVELQMLFATLRKQEESPDQELTKRHSPKELFAIQNNWLAFGNFLSLVSLIDEIQPELRTVKVLDDVRLMIDAIMKHIGFGLQYVYVNVKKMEKGEELCELENYHDKYFGTVLKDFIDSEESCHKLPAKTFLLSDTRDIDFNILPNKYAEDDLCLGLRNFALHFANPYFTVLLSYFNSFVLDDKNHRYRKYHPGPVKSIARMMQKAEELSKARNMPLKEAIRSTSDLCRATFTFQLPGQILDVIERLKKQEDLPQLKVLRIRNRFNETDKFLKELAKKNLNTWSEEGIPHYRRVTLDVLITLPQRCSVTNKSEITFSGTQFVGEIQLLLDSYLFAKRETHKYWKIKRIRQSNDLLNLNIWDHPEKARIREHQLQQEIRVREDRAKYYSGSEEEKRKMWADIVNQAKERNDKCFATGDVNL